MYRLAQCKHHLFKDFIFTILDFYLESANKAISDLRFWNKCNSFLTPWYAYVVFLRKNLRASFSCYFRFEIRPFALLPTISFIIFAVQCQVVTLNNLECDLGTVAKANLSESINFDLPWKHQKTLDFLMIEVNWFA